MICIVRRVPMPAQNVSCVISCASCGVCQDLPVPVSILPFGYGCIIHDISSGLPAAIPTRQPLRASRLPAAFSIFCFLSLATVISMDHFSCHIYNARTTRFIAHRKNFLRIILINLQKTARYSTAPSVCTAGRTRLCIFY